jgi:lipoate-protein ligase A
LSWAVDRRRGSAGELHGLDIPAPARREVWFLEADHRALVVGSTQPDHSVDREACEREGIEVARRRSGGGAVLVTPGEVLWVDVILPAIDPLWHPDVSRATWWLGEAWAAALAACGVSGAVVHRGALVATEWSRLVCFAGLGPGEVTVAGRKVVGISQRRTRDAARFQCIALAAWDAEAMAGLVRRATPPRRPTAAELADIAAGAGVPLADLAASLLVTLPA